MTVLYTTLTSVSETEVFLSINTERNYHQTSNTCTPTQYCQEMSSGTITKHQLAW